MQNYVFTSIFEFLPKTTTTTGVQQRENAYWRPKAGANQSPSRDGRGLPGEEGSGDR